MQVANCVADGRMMAVEARNSTNRYVLDRKKLLCGMNKSRMKFASEGTVASTQVRPGRKGRGVSCTGGKSH